MPRTNYNWPVSLIDRGYLTRRHVPFTYTLPWRLSSPCENLRAENARSSRTTKLDMSAKRGCVSLVGKYVLSSLKRYYIGGGARWLLKKQPTRGRGGGEETISSENRSQILSVMWIFRLCASNFVFRGISRILV